jgi:hypothetical protein
VAGAIAEYQSLAKCLILSDLIQDDHFYNAVVDAIIEIMKTCFPVHVTDTLLKRLPPCSPVLALFRHFWISCGADDWYKNNVWFNDCPEFWYEVARGLTERMWTGGHGRTLTKPWETDRCQYHKHRDGVPRCAGS